MSKKNTIKVVFSFILGMIITSGTVFAVNLISSGDVSFSSTKGLKSTNVQAAIDEVYAETVDYSEIKPKSNCINYYTMYDRSGGDSANLHINRVAYDNYVDVAIDKVGDQYSWGSVGLATGETYYSYVTTYSITASDKDTIYMRDRNAESIFQEIEYYDIKVYSMNTIDLYCDAKFKINNNDRIDVILYNFRYLRGGEVILPEKFDTLEHLKETLNRIGHFSVQFVYPNNTSSSSYTGASCANK